MEEIDIKNKKKDEKPLTYNKNLTCPVCENKFSVPAVKSYSARILKKNTDFFIEYDKINPYFYDIWLCPNCGYAALKSDFEKIKKSSIEDIEQNIHKRWTKRVYPEKFDVDIAIERYKMALLNYAVTDSKSSQKGYVCLKLSWMYRIKGDVKNEQYFAQSALESFINAYYNEDFPFYGMDKSTVQYLIGELYRRKGEKDEALRWFGQVIVSREASSTIKEKAKDQKDLLK